MEYLFDLDKPDSDFTAWLQLLNIDTTPSIDSSLYLFTEFFGLGSPLSYAALCEFQDLVERLIIEHPPQVNTRGGRYVTPLVAALAGKHFERAKLLHHNGACPNVPGRYQGIPLTPCRGLF
jgi:hypothetical protein